jgi:hypothetical protein
MEHRRKTQETCFALTCVISCAAARREARLEPGYQLGKFFKDPRRLGNTSAAHSACDPRSNRTSFVVDTTTVCIVPKPCLLIQVNEKLLERFYRTPHINCACDQIRLAAVVTLQDHDSIVILFRFCKSQKWLKRFSRDPGCETKLAVSLLTRLRRRNGPSLLRHLL